jgi:predicted nuclease with RNAse H fold
VKALGIDVGGRRKGLDIVSMDERRTPMPIVSGVRVGDVGRLIAELRPDVVAIDSPPDWAGPNSGSRDTERQLRALNLMAFNTPSQDRGQGRPFYEWMEVGFEVFKIAARHGYPRYRAGDPSRTAIEVYPHASAAVLAGCLRPDGIGKKTWRIGILRTHGVRVDGLRTADQVDAAMAALTGVMALGGQHFAPSLDPAEGAIVLPSWTAPMPFRPCAERPRDDEALFRYCACGCGTAVGPAREFVVGHDGKLKSALWEGVRNGQRARNELERRRWELPPEMG